jgi:hypothetical protein
LLGVECSAIAFDALRKFVMVQSNRD